MKRKYTIKFNVADIPCRLIIEDKALFNYFKKNYWTEIKQDKYKVLITIQGRGSFYKIDTKPTKLSIKLNMKKKNLLFKDLDWIVRTMLQYGLLKYKIIFLHSSSVFFKNKVYIFLGESGKGKSTIANNFGTNIVGDDILILHKKRKHFYPYQSPFEKSRIVVRKILTKAKVMELFMLNKGEKLEKSPIKSQKIISLLLNDNYIPRLPEVKSALYTELILNLVKETKITNLLSPKNFSANDFFINYG